MSDPRWVDEVVPRLYDELKMLAHSYLHRERKTLTLATTALVHEAWLRLATQHGLGAGDTGRFFAIASTTMRRILVDHARMRKREKRGGGVAPVPLEAADISMSPEEAEELVVLDDALERLAGVNGRAAEVVIHRFFGGLGADETAEVLGVSAKTVQRDWLAARAWLRKEVARDLGLLADPL